MQRSIVMAVVAAAALAGIAGTAEAATAYNSQAGAWGHSKNVCQATPYFPAGGCLSSFFADDGRDLFGEPDAPYRPRARRTAPALPRPDADE